MRRTILMLVLLIAASGLAMAADPAEDAKRAEFMNKLIPSVPKPTATAAQQEQGFIAYWADPTANNFTNVPPADVDLQRKAVIRTTAGEDAPLLIGLWGVRPMHTSALWLTKPLFEMTIRVPEIDRGERPLLYGLGNLGLPWWLGPEAHQDVSQDHNTFYWINIRVPEDAKPGTHRGEVKVTVSEKPAFFADMNSGNQFKIKRAVMPFTVEVLPMKLPRADIAYGMYFRALESIMLPPDHLTKDMMMSYYKDMARHGHTSAYLQVYDRIHKDDGSLVVSGVKEETKKYWAERMLGPYAGLDIYTEHKIKMMQEAGLIYPDIPIMVHYGYALNPQQTKKFALDIKSEFKKRRWPELLLYGPDEPDRARAAEFKETFDRLRAFWGILRRVTAIAPEELDTFIDEFDIWVVYNRAPEETGNMNEYMRKFQQMAKERKAEVWTYDCRTGARNPRYQRYYSGIYTWAHQLKGNFIWCYAEYATWEGDHWGNFPVVLPSKDGPVPSIAWEARREGITDYRYLRQLELLTAKRSDAAAVKARRWLEDLRNRVIYAKVEEGVHIPGDWDKTDLMDWCPQLGRHEMNDIRNQAIDLLLQLRK
jgi:hypothetical protein